MRVLFDIVHPAQVHFFKQAIRQLLDRGDRVMVTSRRRKDVTLELLDALGIEHTPISRFGRGMPRLAGELLVRNYRLRRIARRFRPDVMVARVGIAAGPVGKLLGIPTVVYDDMEHAKLQAAVGLTFATYICTGIGYYRDFGDRQVRFRGSPVLAYHLERVRLPKPAYHPDFMATGGEEYGLTPKVMDLILAVMVPPVTTVGIVRLGDLAIVGIPGEMTAELGLAVRERFGQTAGVKHAVIGGLANEWISYILSADEYTRGGYEASVSLYGPKLGPTLVDAAIRSAAISQLSERCWRKRGTRRYTRSSSSAASVG